MKQGGGEGGAMRPAVGSDDADALARCHFLRPNTMNQENGRNCNCETKVYYKAQVNTGIWPCSEILTLKYSTRCRVKAVRQNANRITQALANVLRKQRWPLPNFFFFLEYALILDFKAVLTYHGEIRAAVSVQSVASLRAPSGRF